jgi:hypothetical protein
MRSVLVMCAALLAGPAWAIEVSNCGDPEWIGTGAWQPFTIACDVKNDGAAAVAMVRYRVVVSQPGRTVPWGDEDAATSIPGGVEPKETRRIEFVSRPIRLPEGVSVDDLVFTVTPTEALDVNGDPIK